MNQRTRLMGEHCSGSGSSNIQLIHFDAWLTMHVHRSPNPDNLVGLGIQSQATARLWGETWPAADCARQLKAAHSSTSGTSGEQQGRTTPEPRAWPNTPASLSPNHIRDYLNPTHPAH
jgi:hypothetical protein